jgi:hypothetical protein
MIIYKGIVLLQNCMNLQRDMEGSYSETCPTSRDAYQATSVKVEDVSDTEQEEAPLPLKYSGIKMEHVVSCMSVCPLLGTFHRYLELCIVFLISICRSLHMKYLHRTEWLLKRSLENVSTGLYIIAHCLWSTNSIWLIAVLTYLKLCFESEGYYLVEYDAV